MSSDVVKGKWTNESAFDLPLALQEARVWIEAVVSQEFPYSDFQASLKDGVFLCKLINQIKPNSVKKLSDGKTSFAQRENLTAFVEACKRIGLRDAQLFDVNDLYEAKRLRNVAICLYWLGRAARAIPTYKGPQLNLLAFKKLNCTACKKSIEGQQPYLATLDKQYHLACAKCSQCHCQLDPKQPYFQNGDKIFCPNCMVGATSLTTDLTLNKKPAPGGKSKDGHDHGHGSDDLCGGCFTDMDGKDHVPEGGKKYCLACICDNCHSPLLGNFTVKNGKKYCDGCSCFDCGVPLTNGFYEEGNLRFCDNCNDKHNKEKTPTLPEKPAHAHGHGHGHPHSHPHDHDHKDHKHGSGPAHVHGPNCSHDTQNLQMKSCKACDKPVAPPSKGKPPAGDRGQFCPPHGDEYCCAHCDLEMSGPVVQAQGKRYHPACHDELKKQKNGNCGGCSKPIEGKPLEALNQKWHPQCFNCTSCHAPFPDGNFIEGDNGKPYCNNCDAGDTTDLSWGPNDKCGGCPKPLAGKVTNVMNKFWHEGCFKCTKCSAKFTSGYFPYDEMPYCEPCHAEVSGADKCAKCRGVVDGEAVKTHEKMWHKKCFTCTTCNKGPLTKDFALIKFGKPYCKVCHAQASAVCPKCRSVITGAYTESGGKVYCEKCAPVSSKNIWGTDKTQGFVIDPRSGKRTWTVAPK